MFLFRLARPGLAATCLTPPCLTKPYHTLIDIIVPQSNKKCKLGEAWEVHTATVFGRVRFSPPCLPARAEVWRGMARRGSVRHGLAWCGLAWCGVAGEVQNRESARRRLQAPSFCFRQKWRHGLVRFGSAGRGGVGFGWVWRGEVRQGMGSTHGNGFRAGSIPSAVSPSDGLGGHGLARCYKVGLGMAW